MLKFKKYPLVSVIVAVYQVEKYIVECAQSLFEQNYDNIEYIFVNDGTKDQSIAILEKLMEEQYSHLKEKIVIKHQENQGPAAARLSGQQSSQGEYLLFVDSDDWLEYNMVEALVKKALEEDADMVYCTFLYEWEDRRRVNYNKAFGETDKNKLIANIFRRRIEPNLANRLIKSDLFNKAELFYPKYNMGEDMLLTIQLIWHTKKIAYTAMPYYHYRMDNIGSLTHTKRRIEKKWLVDNFFDLYEFYEDKKSPNPVTGQEAQLLFLGTWYSIYRNVNPKCFTQRPYLADKILNLKYLRNYYYKSFLEFTIVKIYAFFWKLFH